MDNRIDLQTRKFLEAARHHDMPCLRAKELRQLIKPIIGPNTKDFIVHLVNSGVIREIPVTSSESAKLPVLYLIHDRFETGELDPRIILSTAVPNGIICYLGALEYYELTTQLPPFYHIAKIDNRSQPERQNTGKATLIKNNKPKSIGQLQFYYDNTPCYMTQRSSYTLSGEITGYISAVPIRLTSLEQTLLDSLEKPMHCGGGDIVFEAWETADKNSNINEQKLLKCLTDINNMKLSRRCGCMLDIIGYPYGEELATYLNNAFTNDDEPIMLMRGNSSYNTLDKKWKVYRP
jgi:predicted transcriptional regulator of viral defense system